MATPHVSGAAALVLSACALDTAGVRSALRLNVDPVTSLAGKAATGGRLNVFKAISNCGGALPPPPPVSQDFTVAAAPGSATVKRGGSVTYTVTVGSVGGFGGQVDLAVTGLPRGATFRFSPSSVTPPSGGSAGSTLAIATSPSTGRGTYGLTITGTGTPGPRSTTVSLRVR